MARAARITLAVFVLTLSPVRALGLDWQIETVVPHDVAPGDVAIAFDAGGRPTIAYGHRLGHHSRLRLAVKTGGTWLIQPFDCYGDSVSLAYDAAGRPHIGSCDAYFGGPVQYTTHDGTGWTTRQVVPTGRSPQLALDGQGRPWIAYHTYDGYTAGYLKCGVLDGSSWDIETADGPMQYGAISLAVDAVGRPGIAFHDRFGHDLYCAGRNASGWDTYLIDDAMNAGTSNAIAVDRAARPCVAYNAGLFHLYYAQRDGATWTSRQVTPGGMGPGTTLVSLALDSHDRPHICFCDWYDTDSLMYAAWRGGAWHIEPVDPGGGQYLYGTALALDAHDNPYIAYIADFDVLKVAWVPEPATLALLAAGAAAVWGIKRRT